MPNADWNGTANITFRAWDQTTGTAGSTADSTINGGTSAFSTATASPSIIINPVNDAPVITSNGGGATAAISIAENTTAVTTVTASDADLPAQTLTYSITGGADAAKFAVNASTGALTFVAALDYENPTDADADNAYEVTIQVSDGAGGTDTQALSVTVTPVNDNNPVITSDGGGATAAVSVVENTTVVTTVLATDADLPAAALLYSISGGADAARFVIDGGTGLLTFLTNPDFEAPSDANSDNVYQVTVQVSDGAGGTDSQTMSVTVTDADEFDVGPLSDTNATANAVNENAANGTAVGITAVG